MIFWSVEELQEEVGVVREKAVWSWQPKDKPKPGLEGGTFNGVDFK